MNAAQLKREADTAQAWADASHRGSSVYKALKVERDSLLDALRAITMMAGNLPDEEVTRGSGPNDAVQRGLWYAAARQIARDAIARAEAKR